MKPRYYLAQQCLLCCCINHNISALDTPCQITLLQMKKKLEYIIVFFIFFLLPPICHWQCVLEYQHDNIQLNTETLICFDILNLGLKIHIIICICYKSPTQIDKLGLTHTVSVGKFASKQKGLLLAQLRTSCDINVDYWSCVLNYMFFFPWFFFQIDLVCVNILSIRYTNY